MTNAKISKTAQAMLRNKSVSSAIAQALIRNSYSVARDGFSVKIDGKIYRVKAATQAVKDLRNGAK